MSWHLKMTMQRHWIFQHYSLNSAWPDQVRLLQQ